MNNNKTDIHFYNNTKKSQITKLPLYFFFVLSLLILSWEAHFFYPYYSGATTSPVAEMNWNETSEAFIPEESIRLRIKSNSNSPVDQQLKLNIRDEVNRHIASWTASLEDLDQARDEINRRMPEVEEVISAELEKLGVTDSFKVSLAEVDFPTKQYGDRIYPEGVYEAVFIEIGDGLGDNWWCVLFPPLCFVDIGSDNGEEVAEAKETGEKEAEADVEVSFFVVEVVQSLWNKITAA